MYILARSGDKTSYAPLYIHSFRLLQPHFLADGEKYNKSGLNMAMLKSTSQKLRYCRYKNSMLQSEVAKLIGIDRTTYSYMEEVEHRYYPIDVLRRIADLFGVDIVDLLDDYNLFLYRGQGSQIRSIRQSACLTQKRFAEHLGVQAGTVKRWESDKMRMTRAYWERLNSFKHSDSGRLSSSSCVINNLL